MIVVPVLVCVCALIGVVLLRDNGAGLIFGGAIGFLIATVIRLSERVRALERPQVGAPVPVPRPPTSSLQPMPAAASAVVPNTVTTQSPPPRVTPTVVAVEPRANETEQVMVAWLRDWFSGGRAIPRIGIIILFFGVAFLLKYASEHSMLPIELRLFGAVAGAVTLLVFGWRLRERRSAFALALQGGGIGILYLTVFAALKLYAVLPPLFGFAVLVAVCVFSGALAVLQNARVLAVLGAAGGFLAPVLVSTGGGSHVMLFSYYALLNIGIVGIAWYRAWRELNLLGFAFTFVIGTLWGVRSYQPEMFATTEPFLILYFLFYVAIAVLFALRQPLNLRGLVDGTIVFGVPVVGFALQAALVHDYEFGMAWSAAALGAFYLVLASALWSLRPAALRMMCEAFLALGVVFATLALPLAFDGRWTSAAWALEGAAVIWVGVRQGRLLPRLFGTLLVFSAGVFFLIDLQRPASDLPVLNSIYLGTFLISLAALFAAYTLQRRSAQLYAEERAIAAVLFAWGLLWWFAGGTREIEAHVQGQGTRVDAMIGFAALSAAVAEVMGARLQWSWLRGVALGLLPAGLSLALVTLVFKSHPLTMTGAAAWSALLVVQAALLFRRRDLVPRAYLDFMHGGGVWLLALLGAQELAWIGRQMALGDAWYVAGWGLAPALTAIAAIGMRLPDTWQAHRKAYVMVGALPMVAAACVWLVLVNLTSRADAAPLLYLPLLNPIDLVSALVLMAVAHAVTQPDTFDRDTTRAAWAIGGALMFLWLNAVLLRTLHHWGGVPFEFRAMMNSVLVQASLSIFWTSLALVVMVLAARRGWRSLWMVGGALLIVVVAKLFVVDLDRTGTLARIVSFIVVGVLLLVIGYFAPLPPANRAKEVNA